MGGRFLLRLLLRVLLPLVPGAFALAIGLHAEFEDLPDLLPKFFLAAAILVLQLIQLSRELPHALLDLAVAHRIVARTVLIAVFVLVEPVLVILDHPRITAHLRERLGLVLRHQTRENARPAGCRENGLAIVAGELLRVLELLLEALHFGVRRVALLHELADPLLSPLA